MSRTSTPTLLLRASHPEPTVAVTLLAGLLALSAGHGIGSVLLICVAVLLGQLSIGWSNDLVDAARDRQVRRADKPLATGALTPSSVRVALVVTLAGCALASSALGLRAGLVHLGLLVGSGWAYNLGLKGTRWSWLPYAVAFGSLPAVVTLALDPPLWPPAWMMVGGALLGVGAHLVNVLPDLDDDTLTGVRGLPHRLGRRTTQVAATVILALASVVVVIGPLARPPVWMWGGLALAVTLAVLSLRATGKTPFHAAIVIALLDVVMLVARA